MAGRAGARPAALGLDTRNVVPDCRLHDGRPDLALDGAGRPSGLDVGDLDHGTERTGQSRAPNGPALIAARSAPSKSPPWPGKRRPNGAQHNENGVRRGLWL